MRWIRLAVAVCLTAALLASSSVGFAPYAGASLLLALAVAYGWPRLTDSPQPRATAIMLSLFGFAGIASAWLSEGQSFLEWLPILAGLGLLWTFAQNLVRGIGASDAVANVAAQVSGLVITLCAAVWVSAIRIPGAEWPIYIGLVSVACALAGTCVPGKRVIRWVCAAVLPVAAGLGLGLVFGLTGVPLVSAMCLGLALGILVLAVDRMLGLVADSRFQASELRRARRRDKVHRFGVQLTLGSTPIALGGVVVYVLERVMAFA